MDGIRLLVSVNVIVLKLKPNYSSLLENHSTKCNLYLLIDNSVENNCF